MYEFFYFSYFIKFKYEQNPSVQIYGSSVNGPVRHKCLSVIGKLMYFSTADMIQSLISVTNISRYSSLSAHTVFGLLSFQIV